MLDAEQEKEIDDAIADYEENMTDEAALEFWETVMEGLQWPKL